MCTTEASAQSYGEEGEEVIDNSAPGAPLSERGSDELAARAQRMPSRRSSELGKRERRKRRMDDADEDDLNSLDEPIEGKKKRRGGVYISLSHVHHAVPLTPVIKACAEGCATRPSHVCHAEAESAVVKASCGLL